jgi:flagellar basal-body rod protein FlgB
MKMDLTNLPLFAAMQEKMNWLNRRQGILAENVANANTPGFMPKDLNEPDFGGLLSQYKSNGVQLAVTQPGHMRGANAAVMTSTSSGASVASGGSGVSARGRSRDEKKVKPSEVQPNGNGISVETQMALMSDTQIEYSTLLDVYKKHVSMLNTVLGKGR